MKSILLVGFEATREHPPDSIARIAQELKRFGGIRISSFILSYDDPIKKQELLQTVRTTKPDAVLIVHTSPPIPAVTIYGNIFSPGHECLMSHDDRNIAGQARPWNHTETIDGGRIERALLKEGIPAFRAVVDIVPGPPSATAFLIAGTIQACGLPTKIGLVLFPIETGETSLAPRYQNVPAFPCSVLEQAACIICRESIWNAEDLEAP